ncbi:hypothetical protein CBER1_04616 [Cercospora berteroae]|uniref:Cell wall proline rich protein n=1 Tax=Cercospora berteroae TaxID=357750 RepID=A0A2S6C2G3_9PEZI|nr:hypothetical protein CBER1_04616 [Cercospora berteroae]
MTEVAASGSRGYSHGVGNTLSTPIMAAAAPKIEMQPNPEFSFPRLPPPGDHTLHLEPRRTSHGRPLSMNVDVRPATADARNSHKRAATQQLPTFKFNAGDASGLQAEQLSSQPVEPNAMTPSRGGHRRNHSELVGGVGLNSALSSSPTRPSTLDKPKRAHHSHRRSAAISSHEIHDLLAAAEPQPRLSSSLPSTPLDHPFSHQRTGSNAAALHDPFGPVLDNAASTRPPSRRQVGFSENVEYIPRPLSTISSETESSLNTIRGHSVNNSISSVLSITTPSPPAPRSRAISLETTLEDEPDSSLKSSIETARRVEREGEWLKHGSQATLERPSTASDVLSKSLTFAADNVVAKTRSRTSKKHTASRSLGFDRRKSEPTINLLASEPSRLSALSLQESTSKLSVNTDEDETASERRFSTRKIKDWAVSKIARRSRPRSEVLAPKQPMQFETEAPRSVAETDLDAVFSMDNDSDIVHDRSVPAPSQLDIPQYSQPIPTRNRDSEEGAMLDLDDALSRPKTPTQVGLRRRRMLHSDRGFSDFIGPGAHYQPPATHHRTASAPVLMAFDQSRSGTPPQTTLAVFDEEEEDQSPESSARPSSTASTSDDEGSTEVSVVDADPTMTSAAQEASLDEGLGIQRNEWDLETPHYTTSASRLSTPAIERRASSIIEQTIFEETSPVESVAIAHDAESFEQSMDLRAHSLTKSSDSSEAPTIMAAPSSFLSLPDDPHAYATPETSTSSAFSSPDFTRRQNSFEASRVGTSASSIADNRTMSSCTTGEVQQDYRMSVDDVPSLTSSRSTMASTAHANSSRRDVSGLRTPSLTSGSLESAEGRRRKRASIQSLSQLVGGPFGPRSQNVEETRPSTAATETILSQPKKKEHRLKKLMFWKSKRQFSTSTVI